MAGPWRFLGADAFQARASAGASESRIIASKNRRTDQIDLTDDVRRYYSCRTPAAPTARGCPGRLPKEEFRRLPDPSPFTSGFIRFLSVGCQVRTSHLTSPRDAS